MSTINLFHTGFAVIPAPDIRYGRQNADFGQGFYLSDNEEFSRRWAQERRGQTTYLNRYVLDCAGLKIKRFRKDGEWFNYIYDNRTLRPDALKEYDVIVGPIANDTIYDTWGILTSGLISRENALQLLLIGPAYEQTVLKTDRAAGALHFLGAEEIKPEAIKAYRAILKQEEEIFQQEFAKTMEKLSL